MLVDIIAGARPNFMKIAPIIHELKKRASEGGALGYRLAAERIVDCLERILCN